MSRIKDFYNKYPVSYTHLKLKLSSIPHGVIGEGTF